MQATVKAIELTVECDGPSRCAAAFSAPASRTAATTPTARSVARSGRDDRRIVRSAASRGAPAVLLIAGAHA